MTAGGVGTEAGGAGGSAGAGTGSAGAVGTDGVWTGGTTGNCAAASPVSPIEIKTTPATNDQRQYTILPCPRFPCTKGSRCGNYQTSG